MAQKSIEIDFKKIGQQIKLKTNQAKSWLNNFFQTIDDKETIATVVLGLGFILFLIGIIIV